MYDNSNTDAPKMLKKNDLEPGDIFLCVFENPGVDKNLNALYTVLKHFIFNNVPEDDLKKAESIILRGLITYFDQDMYSHAAFWNGNKIVQAGPNGVGESELDSYKNVNTHVVRFAKNNREVLGTSDYPVQPLLDYSQYLVDQHLPYSYYTAYLMIALCVTRWNREQWISDMEDFIKSLLKSDTYDYIHFLFDTFHDRIIRGFEWMADEMIRQIVAYKKDDGLVCSETVAAIFNEAKPVGKYFIEKPLHAPSKLTRVQPVQQNSEEVELIVHQLKELLGTPSDKNEGLGEPVDWEQVVDIIYTPHDLAHSKDTTFIGSLVLK